MKRLAALALLTACGTSSPPSGPAPLQVGSGKYAGRSGDVGTNSPVIDHSGPNGGLVAPLSHGMLSGEWQPAGCPGTVPIAAGVTDAAWGEDDYGNVDRSPHAVHTSFRFDASSSLAVVWETDAATHASFVAYGDSPDKLDHFVQGISFTNPPQTFDRLPYPLTVHEAHLCGLSPGRTYWFAVGGDGWYGNVYPVRTAPAPGSDAPFRILVMGDSNGFPDLFADLAPLADSYGADFAVFTGDMVHEGSMATEWEAWFSAAGSLFAKVPVMTAHGNHEGMATGYFALFALPGVEEIYSFDYGNAHFVVLNDSPQSGEQLTDRQAAFLDADLAAAKGRPVPPVWLVTSHHRPMYSSDPQEGSNLTVRAAWQPIQSKYGVDVDLNGHSHHYEMTTPVMGTRYVTAGGGGASFDPSVPTSNPWTVSYYAGLSVAVVDVNGRTMSIQGYRQDGSPIQDAPVVLTK